MWQPPESVSAGGRFQGLSSGRLMRFTRWAAGIAASGAIGYAMVDAWVPRATEIPPVAQALTGQGLQPTAQPPNPAVTRPKMPTAPPVEARVEARVDNENTTVENSVSKKSAATAEPLKRDVSNGAKSSRQRLMPIPAPPARSENTDSMAVAKQPVAKHPGPGAKVSDGHSDRADRRGDAAPAVPVSAHTATDRQLSSGSLARRPPLNAKLPPAEGLELQALSWADAPEKRLAVINGRFIREGGRIDGYVVSRIEEESVVLSMNGRNFRIRFPKM